MPQVDAVRAPADVAKNSRAERRSQERSRVSHRGDQRCGEEGEGEKTPAIQPRCELTDEEIEADDGGEGCHANPGDDELGSAWNLGAQSPGPPHGGQRCADQQTHAVRVGTEVRAAGIGVDRVAIADRQDRHPHRRRDRQHQGESTNEGTSSRPHQQEGEHRPDQVELLFDGQ